MAIKCSFLRTWAGAVSKPGKTFAAELKKKPTLMQGSIHILLASIVSAVVMGLSGELEAVYGMMALTNPAIGYLFWAVLLLVVILMSVITWLALSGVMYFMSRLLKGRGNFAQQSYLIAIYTAPVTAATSIISLAGQIGGIINTIIGVYSLYLLTVALRTVHKYSTGRAIVTWLIPLLAALVLVAIGFLTLSLLGLPIGA